MSKNKILSLKLNLITEDDSIRKIIIDYKDQKFEFKSNDETYEEIDRFSDYILENVEEYDEIAFEINEDTSGVNLELAKAFKKIWIDEFNEIKKELNKLLNNKESQIDKDNKNNE